VRRPPARSAARCSPTPDGRPPRAGHRPAGTGEPGPPPVGDPQVAGAVPFYTPNADFYRVDTALTVPEGRRRTWSLRISGMVDRPVTLSLDDLLARPLVERTSP
jgi:DMSO/TMAO reductase YedYZ molybdopterin-dependent catalytic subunit